MIKHLVVWTLKAPEDKATRLASLTPRAEALVGQIPGLRHLEVIDGLPIDPAAGDIALYAELDDLEALAVYQKHPLHTAFGNEEVKPFTASRRVIDWQA
ncbi:MAG: Dabb family protein [Burkholderiales bacterium]|jgi:hypothetical protein|nr:Dabb family protein [Burkholderiales bacterium]